MREIDIDPSTLSTNKSGYISKTEVGRQVLSLRREGKSIEVIAEAVGASKYSVARYLRKIGAPKKRAIRKPHAEYVAPPKHRDSDPSWGAWLQSARTACKMDCQTLASLAGVSAPSITLYQRGGIPPRHVAAAIGRALGKESETLVRCGYIPAAIHWQVLSLVVPVSFVGPGNVPHLADPA